MPNRGTNPWEASLFDVATQPESSFYDALETNFGLALKYYDEVVGAADISRNLGPAL